MSDDDLVDFSYSPSPIPYRGKSPRPRKAKSISGLGVASVLLGCAACLFCWIPYVGVFSIPISAIGILFALLGMLTSIVGRRSRIGMCFAGLFICLIGVGITVATTTAWAVVVDHLKLANIRFAKPPGEEMSTAESNQTTALIMASELGPLSDFQKALSGCTDVNRLDYKGVGALHAMATSITWPDAMNALDDSRKPDDMDQAVQMLILRGADINLRNKFGETPLKVAIDYDHIGFIRILLDRKADPNATDRNGDPLIFATRNQEVLKLLVDAGANVNSINSEGQTLLIKCVGDGKVDEVQCLIDHGVSINDRDKNNLTALMHAKMGFQSDIVELLKRNGGT